jgi:hypothetical protein
MIFLVQNNFLLILNVILVVLFVSYVAKKWRYDHKVDDVVTIAWSLALNYMARLIDRAMVIVHHRSIPHMIYITAVVTTLAISIWSAVCVLKVFSGVTWGRRATLWIFAVAISVALLVTFIQLVPETG